MAKASAKVVRSLAMRNRFWFGMTISVSTHFCSSLDALPRRRACGAAPSKWNGLVTTPTVRMPCSRAARAMTGAAPVPVPPPMPAVMNTMCAPFEVIVDLVDHLLGGRAADFGLRAGAETLGDGDAHLDDALGLRQRQRLGVGVGHDELDAPQPAWIMLLTALPPAPPTPKTVIRGFSSVMSGIFRLIVMAPSPHVPVPP